MKLAKLGSRNVYNVSDIENTLEGLVRGKSKYFQQWVKTNYRNHVIRNFPALLVLPASMRLLVKILEPLFLEKKVRLTDRYHFVPDSEAPDWLKKALDDGEFVWYVPLNIETQKIVLDHWFDYVRAEMPDKNLSAITPQEMEKQTEAWVEKLRKEKIIADDLLQISKLWANDKYMLVSLNTKAAYAFEGQRMHNCVKSYWREPPRAFEILSLRTLDNVPLVTLEVWPFVYHLPESISLLSKVKITPPISFIVINQIKEAANNKVSRELLVVLKQAMIAAFPDKKSIPEANLPPQVAKAFLEAQRRARNQHGEEYECDDEEECDEDCDEEGEDLEVPVRREPVNEEELVADVQGENPNIEDSGGEDGFRWDDF